MILNIIIGLAAAFGIFWSIKEKKTFPAIITLGMVVGIVWVFFQSKTIHISGFYIYMGFLALAFTYGLTVKEKKIWTRIIICLMAASIFTYWLWVLNHWHGDTLFLPIFTLLLGVIGIFSKAQLKNELGFLVIIVSDSIAIIIEQLLKAH